MQKLPMVDVVIPTYNYADQVTRAIESVRSQSLTNLHCYIVDDGSTDNTAEVVQEFIEGDARFEYIHKNNGGVATARNTGIFAGNGKYVCCLDADDKIDPKYLETCVRALEEDRTIDIAYTGLWYIKPDGDEGLSQWPDEYDYDDQLQGQNQLPTCNVARRKVWERLGGQRQRYAPHGAGEEDAEMWLRAGSLGFMAKKVSHKGLFIYSWMSGRVSGSTEHKTTDYMSYHPWAYDSKHPLASVATPEKFSHLVRQYDEPIISVIIPVGPGHENYVVDAIDSIEAQTFRKWELIVVWDNSNDTSYIKSTYPYVRLVLSHKFAVSQGAGFARNRGAEIARAPFLLFLDADDQLHPEALHKMLDAWEYEQSIVYTDHIGKALLSKDDANGLGERLLSYDEKLGQAIFWHGWRDYDCDLASKQPDVSMYHWCLVTSLVPKSWHNEIGGFDEEMSSWEDWDYYIRMAKRGKCFVRIPDRLVVYRYYTGGRRDEGLHDHESLIQYMLKKYKDIEIMPCNCRGKNRIVNINPPKVDNEAENMIDENFVLINYNHPNRGQHRVIGPSTGTDYAYHAGGDMFLVHKNDMAAMPAVFIQAETPAEAVSSAEIFGKADVPGTPKMISEKSVAAKKAIVEKEKVALFSLQHIAGITSIGEQHLNAMNVHSVEDVVALGVEGLVKVKGIGDKRAEAIIISATEMMDAVLRSEGEGLV